MQTGWILELRKTRRLGARRIANELKRLYDFSLSLATVQKVLTQHRCSILPRRNQQRKGRRRYNRPIPGDRVQFDVMKVGPRLYQYTAIDDCTRYRILALYPRRTAANSVDFLEKVQDEIPFPIQRVQTDRGLEFFAYAFHNCSRPHGSLGNRTSREVWLDKAAITPLSEEVFYAYDESRETIRYQDYTWIRAFKN